MFGPVAPGGQIVGWASAAAFIWLTWNRRASRRKQLRNHQRAHVEAWLGTHTTVDGVAVAVLPVEQTLAYAVPVGSGQIVISEGLVQALDPAELDAVLAHEASHLRNHHDRHLSVAALVESAFGWFGPARASAANLRLAIERWADEDAATSPARRDLIRTALSKTTSSLLGPVLAFASTCTVLQRLDALEDGPPSPDSKTRMAALAPLVAAGLVTVALLGTWSTYSHHGLLGILGFCPS